MMIARFRPALWILFFLTALLLPLTGEAAAPASRKPASSPAPPAKLQTASTTTAPSFAINPLPSWVRPYTLDPAPPTQTEDEGLAYLLVDSQENVEPRASFYHEAHLITSDKGLQNGASLAATFDPSYEKLTFHYVHIHRSGKVIDRLDRSQFRLLQREREADSFLYDGSFTADCQLEDVRVGDIVEYAYTVEGANPVLRGRFFDTFSTQMDTPVRRAIVRVVRPDAHPLYVATRNRTIHPVITKDKGTTEWLWDESDIPMREMDPDTPKGYSTVGIVQFTDFASWQQVVDWAVPLYRVATPNSPDLDEEVARLRALPSDLERIVAALRFVQEDIRYLGIESGVGSHQPTPPSEVLRRRFGDCKDKTLLLASILQQCGIEATPSLVSSSRRRYVADRLPSPGIFNHVILRVASGKDVWWLDATRDPQRGPLSQIYVSNFGFALILQPGTTELAPCAPQPTALPKRKLVEHYHIAKPGSDTRLDVVTECRGVAADSTRSFFQTKNKEEVQKKYLQYYARRFARIRVAQPVTYEELPGENATRVQEHYIIPDIWQLSENKEHYHLTLYPTDVDNEMGTPGGTERHDPLAISYPVDVTQGIHAEMFEDWPLTPSHREINNAFFQFRHDSKGSGRNIEMTYAYRSLTDQVPINGLVAYDDALRKIEPTLGYKFTYQTPAQLAHGKKTETNTEERETQFNWPIALLAGMVAAVALMLAIGFYRNNRLTEPLPPPLEDRRLNGIGGWLVLVTIGLTLRPLLYLTSLVQLYPTVFHMAKWHRLTLISQSGYHPFWMPALLFELFYNILILIYSLLLLVLFFQKRAVWPRCFIVLMAATVAAAVIDYGFVLQIPAAAGSKAEDAKDIGRAVFAAMIWIPYALVSKRVKATFRF